VLIRFIHIVMLLIAAARADAAAASGRWLSPRCSTTEGARVAGARARPGGALFRTLARRQRRKAASVSPSRPVAGSVHLRGARLRHPTAGAAALGGINGLSEPEECQRAMLTASTAGRPMPARHRTLAYIEGTPPSRRQKEQSMSHQPPKQSKKKPQHTPKEKKLMKQQKKHVSDTAPFIKH
jgi:hypothetical protein